MSRMITLTEDGHFLASDNINAGDYINMTLNVQLQMFNQLVANAGEDAEVLKEELYDIYNKAASAFLEAFAPEIELRPDLTAEAILKAENEILDAQEVEA